MFTVTERGKEDYIAYFEKSDLLSVVKDFYADREDFSLRENLDTAAVKASDILTNEEMEAIPVEKNAFPAIEGCKLWVKVGDKYYPFSTNAIRTNGMRTKLNGDGLFLMDNALLKNVILNIYGKLTGKDCIVKVIIIDNMVRAILSADYKIVPIKDVIDTLENYLSARWKKFEFNGGSSTYDKVSLMFKFNTTEEVPLLYGRQATWESGLKFESSDTGFCSNVVKACWYTEAGNIVFDDVTGKVRLIHKGENDLAAFEKSLNTLFVKLHDRASYIQKQLNVFVANPTETIEMICSDESPVMNKAMFKTLIGKKDCKAILNIWEEQKSALKTEYEEYISLLDEDEEIPAFKVTMYDIIQCFMKYQDFIKPEKREKLEYFCGVLLITDFDNLV